MLVCEKVSNHPDVIETGKKWQNHRNFYRERGVIFLHNRFCRKQLFDVSIANTGLSVTEHPAFKEADVIHLHWINQGMLSLREIEKILVSGKKTVWTMHDMWPFTGICHHAGDCNNYRKACGNCAYLRSSSEKDLSQRVFAQKKEIYDRAKITFIACSEWLKGLAQESRLTQKQTVVSIPNPIDTTLYRPKASVDARKRLHLPLDKKLMLFAAMKASDKRKGIDYLMQACKMMRVHEREMALLIAGKKGTELTKAFSLPTYAPGWVSPEKMIDLYHAADLFVTPSLQDNLPNTIMEAMACGTPCVGFRTGGIPEMIDHGKTGYVAKYKDAEDLAQGIEWSLFKADGDKLSQDAREKVVARYGEERVANLYRDIYAG